LLAVPAFTGPAAEREADVFTRTEDTERHVREGEGRKAHIRWILSVLPTVDSLFSSKVGQMTQLDISLFMKPGTDEVDWAKLEGKMMRNRRN
jgi:hypothetical protein